MSKHKDFLCLGAVSLIARVCGLVFGEVKAAVVGVQVVRLLSPDHVEGWHLCVVPRDQLNVVTRTSYGGCGMLLEPCMSHGPPTVKYISIRQSSLIQNVLSFRDQ